MATRVKICGLTRRQDAIAAIEAGADALGFVLEPSSPRCLTESDMEWVRALPPIPCKVAVFGKVNRVAFKGIYDLIQGSEWDEYPEPAAKRILALRIKASQSPQDFRDITVNAAAILLDAHTEGQYGGTGQTIDWDFAAEFVQRSESPVILAGGLNPDNVAEAVQRVRPFMVDVSTGVEATLRNKDKAKIIDFIQAAKNA